MVNTMFSQLKEKNTSSYISFWMKKSYWKGVYFKITIEDKQEEGDDVRLCYFNVIHII